MKLKTTRESRRKLRTRSKIRRCAKGRPRLHVHRTSQNIYAQVIDDAKGVTLAAASTLDAGLKGKAGGNRAAAEAVGKLVAERAKGAGIVEVVFDRGSCAYHGRIKALAEAARAGGLQF